RAVEHMMAKDPAARPQSYDELIHELEALRPGRQEHSGFWARGMAMLIDLAPLGILAAILHLFALPIALAYFWVAHARFGRTLGKWLLRLQVIDANGEPPGWKKAGIRLLVFLWGPIVWTALAFGIYFTYRETGFVIKPGQVQSGQLVGPVMYGIA